MSSIKFRLRGSFLAVLAVGLVWIGCTDNRADLTSPADLGPNILVVDQVALSHAIRVQKAHTDEMFEIAGVVGTGVGLTADGQPAVKIFTREAGVAGLPESLEGVPVAVEVTGMIFALRALADPADKFTRPVPIGVSTGHPDITAGTIGARVTDGTNVFALSNNHVYANANAASIGDNALQPGPFDGGTDPADAIGTLFDFEPIEFAKRRKIPTNTMDAAIVVSSTDMLGYATPQGGYGAPSSTTVSAYVNQLVKKYGRTSGLTHGTVYAVNVIVDVCYEGFVVCTKWARFTKQIMITPGAFSGGGDSGSLIVTDDGNNDPVGLLFAGSSTHTIANRIDLVLSRFGVTIDAGGPVTPVTDVAVTDVSAPASVVQGDAVSVGVTVENVGNQNVTSDIGVTLTDDGVTIGTQTIGGLAAGATTTLTYSWDTGSASPDDHVLTASHNFGDGDASNDSKSATVTVNEPPPPGGGGVTVDGIGPNSMDAGTSIDVTIAGSGFAGGAEVTFENGSGPTPTVSNVVVVDGGTITATVTVKSGGPRGIRVWDVRVTNADSSSGVLEDGFTVQK